MELSKAFELLAGKHSLPLSGSLSLQVVGDRKRAIIKSELQLAAENSDMITAYSLFFLGGPQSVFDESPLELGREFYRQLYPILGKMLSVYLMKTKSPCKKTIMMILEMILTIVSVGPHRLCPATTLSIVEALSSRSLDGVTLCLFALILVCLRLQEEEDEVDNANSQIQDEMTFDPAAESQTLEDSFFAKNKFNESNKPLKGLFRCIRTVIGSLSKPEAAVSFLKSLILSTSEVHAEVLSSFPQSMFALEVLVTKANHRVRYKLQIKGFGELLYTLSEPMHQAAQTNGVSSVSTTTKHSSSSSRFKIPRGYNSFVNVLKKSYYTLALRESEDYPAKLAVLNAFIAEKLDVTQEDADFLDSMVMKISSSEQFEVHLKLLKNLLQLCADEQPPGYLCFMFLMLIFEDVSEYCKTHGDTQSFVKAFLEIQFIRFPPEMADFRRYKCLLIKYYPFYMCKNLSFLSGVADPVKEIITRHKEIRQIFEESVAPIKMMGLDIGLLNPLDILRSGKLQEIITNDQSGSEHFLDSLRLEVEIWENFIHQVAQFDKLQKQSYQCMMMFTAMKSRKDKIMLGHFLQHLCIHNDELVRLILRQGFEEALIPDAVEYIEWFHAILIYYDPLLRETSEGKKRHFYYKLVTESIKKYPAQVSKDVARSLMLNHFTCVELNPGEVSVVLLAVKSLLETFPSLDAEKALLISHFRTLQKELCPFDISYVYIDRLTKELDKITVTKS